MVREKILWLLKDLESSELILINDSVLTVMKTSKKKGGAGAAYFGG